MRRWLMNIVMLVGMAGCAGQQPAGSPPGAAEPTPGAAAVIGNVLVPAESGGMRLLVTEVNSMELSSGKYNFSVNFDLTNLDLDQAKITMEVFEFSAAGGKLLKPSMMNVFAMNRTSNREYTLQRGETQPFSIDVFTDSDAEIALIYYPPAAAVPIQVSVVSAPANADSRFRDLDLLALSAPRDEFSQPIQLVDGSQTAVNFSRTAFAEPERYLHGTLLNAQETIGTLSVYVYDNPQNTQIMFDSRAGFVGADERHRVERLGPASMYVEGVGGVQRFASAGFVACHAAVVLVFNHTDPALFPAKPETLAYLEGIKQRLEPQVCP